MPRAIDSPHNGRVAGHAQPCVVVVQGPLFDALMKAEPELEGRLERGTALGLGYLDVRHDGTVCELRSNAGPRSPSRPRRST
jgi:hypothetical protein